MLPVVAVDPSLSLSLSPSLFKHGLRILVSSGKQQVNYWDRRHAAIASGGGDGTLRTAIKRLKLSGPRKQRAVGDGNASEESGAPRGRKRVGRTKKSEAGSDADASASGSAVVHDGNPKRAITACEHTNCPLYSKALCKSCYMVSSLFYEAPA